jgi:hypothetical protein
MKQIDLSGYRMVPLEEVAALFNLTTNSVQSRVWNGRFPVKPKMKKPLQWSSVELRAYFEDGRRGAR